MQQGRWRAPVAGIAAGALAAVVAGTVATGPAQAAPARGRTALPRTAPRWVAGAHKVRPAKASKQISFRVYLAPNGGLPALQSAVAAVSDPHSSSYRTFLSASAYHATYDPTTASVSTVRGWLSDQGLTTTSVEAHHRYLDVSGSVASAEKALKVGLARYRHHGRTVRANDRAVSLPSAIAGLVTTVTGLDTTPHKIKHLHSTKQPADPPGPGFRNARPCSRSYGQVPATYQADFKTPLPKFRGKTLPYAVCGYTGPQYRAAYEGATAADGAGVTVAITDAYASPTIFTDAGTYATRHGDGSYAAGQLTQRQPSSYNRKDDCGPAGWYGEETLDVEAVHAMAPGAKIIYYASASCYDDDFLTTLNKVVDQNKVSLVSNSWSDLESNETPASVAAYEQVFLQGAMQGIGFMFSSGDNGDEVANTGLRQVDYPASDPYVTAVGGTADAIDATGSFAFQTGWGTQSYSLSPSGTYWSSVGYLYGAGGGQSDLFNQPAYQRGVVPARYGASRTVPDIGLDADPQTGMLIGQTQTFSDGVYYDEYRIGGTSLASPLFAGMAAVGSQSAGGRLGFLNPSLYAQAGSPAITDIKGTPPDAGQVRANYVNAENGDDGLAYFVRTFNQDSSLKVAPGWDDVTGLGSPNPVWLARLAN